KDHFALNSLSHDELSQKLSAILEHVKDLPEKKRNWEQYLTSLQVYAILEDESVGDALLSTLKSDFEDICEFDKLQDSLEPHETQLINKVLEVADQEKYTNKTEVRETQDAIKDSRQIYGNNANSLEDSLVNQFDPEDAFELNADAVEQLFQNSL